MESRAHRGQRKKDRVPFAIQQGLPGCRDESIPPRDSSSQFALTRPVQKDVSSRGLRPPQFSGPTGPRFFYPRFGSVRSCPVHCHSRWGHKTLSRFEWQAGTGDDSMERCVDAGFPRFSPWGSHRLGPALGSACVCQAINANHDGYASNAQLGQIIELGVQNMKELDLPRLVS